MIPKTQNGRIGTDSFCLKVMPDLPYIVFWNMPD